MATLTLSYKGVSLKEFQLSGDRITIGRHSDNNIRLDDPTVSGLHAVLSVQPDPYMEGQVHVTLLDFNSTNGVFVNGEKIKQHSLRSGDVIKIGQHELMFDQQGGSPFERTAVLLQDEE
jgi:pSer/pThr/pTyr-binding forkhead associated (FHA) protein